MGGAGLKFLTASEAQTVSGLLSQKMLPRSYDVEIPSR